MAPTTTTTKPPSSLIVTTTGNTALDRLTRAIYPDPLIAFLNTPLIVQHPVNINLWSGMHVAYGAACYGAGLGVGKMLLVHTLFELGEVVLAGLAISEVDTAEWMDIALDTAFSLAGYGVVKRGAGLKTKKVQQKI